MQSSMKNMIDEKAFEELETNFFWFFEIWITKDLKKTGNGITIEIRYLLNSIKKQKKVIYFIWYIFSRDSKTKKKLSVHMYSSAFVIVISTSPFRFAVYLIYIVFALQHVRYTIVHTQYITRAHTLLLSWAHSLT